jgi:hypothetical protein
LTTPEAGRRWLERDEIVGLGGSLQFPPSIAKADFEPWIVMRA